MYCLGVGSVIEGVLSSILGKSWPTRPNDDEHIICAGETSVMYDKNNLPDVIPSNMIWSVSDMILTLTRRNNRTKLIVKVWYSENYYYYLLVSIIHNNIHFNMITKNIAKDTITDVDIAFVNLEYFKEG